jgi:hypothetical protein
LLDFLLELLVDGLQLLDVAVKLGYFLFLFLFGLEQLQSLILFRSEFLVEFVHDLFQLLFLILIPDGAFELLFKFIGSIPFKLQFRFSLNFRWILLPATLFYARGLKTTVEFAFIYISEERFHLKGSHLTSPLLCSFLNLTISKF